MQRKNGKQERNDRVFALPEHSPVATSADCLPQR